MKHWGKILSLCAALMASGCKPAPKISSPPHGPTGPMILPWNNVRSSDSAPPFWQPPRTMQGDAAVWVEFLQPSKVEDECGNGVGDCFQQRREHGKWVAQLILHSPCGVDLQDDDYALALCHELGHVNGWGSLHEGGYFPPRYAHAHKEDFEESK